MTGPMATDVLDRLRGFVAAEIGRDSVAAFVYGSVAARRTVPGSDIDFFVITNNLVPSQRRREISAVFVALQRELGFIPDLHYPIEVFSVTQCLKALYGPAVKAALCRMDTTDRLPANPTGSDEIEILRALLDFRIEILVNSVLFRLTSQARLSLYTWKPIEE